MDHLKRFVAEQLDVAPGITVGASQLFDRYGKWCVQQGEHSLTVQEFKAKLEEALDVTFLVYFQNRG